MDEQNTAVQTEACKFCKHCGQEVASAAVVCPHCGCLAEEIPKDFAAQKRSKGDNTKANTDTNENRNMHGMRGSVKNKWAAICLCLLLGVFGAHKFYEGKVGMGILYLFTGGLFFFGVLIDFLALLSEPDSYYV